MFYLTFNLRLFKYTLNLIKSRISIHLNNKMNKYIFDEKKIIVQNIILH